FFLFLFVLLFRQPPRPPLFPYTTLFRSRAVRRCEILRPGPRRVQIRHRGLSGNQVHLPGSVTGRGKRICLNGLVLLPWAAQNKGPISRFLSWMLCPFRSVLHSF